jgi:glucosamine--fructose-6-phosphate aminotransferase (isomerizing)
MCGITGMIGKKNAFKYIIQGLKMLQNRGYDSAGVCSILNNELILNKYASTNDIDSIERLEEDNEDHKLSSISIGHTRWATHGAKTDVNSHPHLDHTNKIAVVHNGIIENYFELKQELLEKHNIKLRSQTDTEVISNLISINYDRTKDMVTAIKNTTDKLSGTWGICVLNKDYPNNLYCARHGSSLLIGFGDDYMMVASEQSGFAGNCNNYIIMKDNDIISLEDNNGTIDFKTDKYQIKTILKNEIELTPEPYPNWTLKEINEQYQSSIRSISLGGRLLDSDSVKLGGLNENLDLLMSLDHLIILGCGTSLYAGMYGRYFFKDLCNFDTVQVFGGAEFEENDIPRKGNTGLIFLSQSGETKDLARCLDIGKRLSLPMIGVVNVVDSMIAREVTCGCYLNAGREVGVASTKSYTSQVILLSMIAIWFAQNKNINIVKRKEYIKCLRQLPRDIKETIEITKEVSHNVAKYLKDRHHGFILGRGSNECIAREAGLKITELGSFLALAMGGKMLRHGVYSALQKNDPILFINPDLEMHSVNEEVKSRYAKTICVSDCLTYKDNYDYFISIPKNNKYVGLLSVFPCQLIAYYLALERNLKVDKPLNLAKSLTV